MISRRGRPAGSTKSSGRIDRGWKHCLPCRARRVCARHLPSKIGRAGDAVIDSQDGDRSVAACAADRTSCDRGIVPRRSPCLPDLSRRQTQLDRFPLQRIARTMRCSLPGTSRARRGHAAQPKRWRKAAWGNSSSTATERYLEKVAAKRSPCRSARRVEYGPHAGPSRSVRPPRVSESPGCFECETLQVIV